MFDDLCSVCCSACILILCNVYVVFRQTNCWDNYVEEGLLLLDLFKQSHCIHYKYEPQLHVRFNALRVRYSVF